MVAEVGSDAFLMRKYATFMGFRLLTQSPDSKADIEALQENLDQLQRDLKVGEKIEGDNFEGCGRLKGRWSELCRTTQIGKYP